MLISELLFGKSNVPVSSEVIRMTEVRHKELVNNIANMDTPYYKAKDINVDGFKNVLGAAIDNRKSSHPWVFRMGEGRDVQGRKGLDSLHMKDVKNLTEGDISTGFKVLRRVDDTVMRHDQNNVTAEGEMSRLGKNAALHRAFVTLARNNFSMIESALRLRV
jgi:flagellar basal-body rod protein FlgB